MRSGGEDFDRSAVLAVSQWRYRPAMRKGSPVAVPLTVIVDFNIGARQSRPGAR